MLIGKPWNLRLAGAALRSLASMLLFVIGSRITLAQSLNPPYLKEMPSVERVLREEQSGDPKQSALTSDRLAFRLHLGTRHRRK